MTEHLTFTYALVLTEFEKSIAGSESANFDYLIEQDYTVHCLYCHNTDSILFLNSNLKVNTQDMIYIFIDTLHSMNITTEMNNKIIVISKEESEYNKADVIKYFR